MTSSGRTDEPVAEIVPTPSQSLCSIPSLSIAASCLVRFQLLLLCAERDSRQEPPLTSTTSVAWPEPGEFESQTGLAATNRCGGFIE